MKLSDCNPIGIVFTFEHQASGDTKLRQEHFEVDDSLESTVQDYIDEWLEENENYAFVEREVTEWDDDFAKPEDFDDLDEYGAYVEKCVEHGEAFKLRYDDIGDFDFDDEYNGCWDSEEEFVQNLIEDCYDIPDFLQGYVDWEKMTRDVMMDYSSYYGADGYHIFRD